MTEDPTSPPTQNGTNLPADDPALEPFYVQAQNRILRCMLIAGLVALPILFWLVGWNFALGFLLGGALALLNFRWLERTVSSLSDFIIKNPDRQPTGRVVRRFLLRYVLIAVGAYVILKGLGTAVYGFFAGLFLPVVGIFCEAVYELFTSFRSPS